MAINWDTVTTNMGKAVCGVVGEAWSSIPAGASTQLAAVIAVGQSIEQNKGALTQAEYDTLKNMQKNALQGVLQAYEGISLDIAQQAAAAAWSVIVGALKTAYPTIGLLL